MNRSVEIGLGSLAFALGIRLVQYYKWLSVREIDPLP